MHAVSSRVWVSWRMFVHALQRSGKPAYFSSTRSPAPAALPSAPCIFFAAASPASPAVGPLLSAENSLSDAAEAPDARGNSREQTAWRSMMMFVEVVEFKCDCLLLWEEKQKTDFAT